MSEALMHKIRREQIRWFLLVAANVSRPAGIYTEAMLPIVQATYPDATHREIRLQLDYLEERALVKITKDSLDRWFVELTRFGIDVVEYTLPVEPGIARPTITVG
jgi:hypothetical protein